MFTSLRCLLKYLNYYKMCINSQLWVYLLPVINWSRLHVKSCTYAFDFYSIHCAALISSLPNSLNKNIILKHKKSNFTCRNDFLLYYSERAGLFSIECWLFRTPKKKGSGSSGSSAVSFADKHLEPTNIYYYILYWMRFIQRKTPSFVLTT